MVKDDIGDKFDISQPEISNDVILTSEETKENPSSVKSRHVLISNDVILVKEEIGNKVVMQ